MPGDAQAMAGRTVSQLIELIETFGVEGVISATVVALVSTKQISRDEAFNELKVAIEQDS